MNSFKVIGATSYRTFRVIWMLEELGVQYQHVVAHPWSKLARQHHALGKVPVLIATTKNQPDDTIRIFESGAILTYLGDLHKRFLPTSTPRPLFDQTMHMLISEVDAGLWIHRKHDALGEHFGKATPNIIQEAQRSFQSANQVLAKQLSPYLLGNEFSVVDIMYVHMLDWADAIGWDYLQRKDDNEDIKTSKDMEMLSNYVELCRSRPAYKRTVEKRNTERAEAKRKAEEKQEKQTDRQTTANL